ncbi:MAG: N-acetylmuramoyl-L-alanine amidase [Clostridia bacterium]|nr:N-acetylmuramoyl-L-alanine amidase [Clostridia bacterium]
MNARTQLIKFTAVWLAIFIICSILSAFAYSSDSDDPSKPSDSDDPKVVDKTKEDAPDKRPDSTDSADTPDDPDDPATDPDSGTPYAELTYSAENAQYLIFVDAGHGWFDNGSSVRLTADGEYVYEKKDENNRTVRDENGDIVYVTESGKTVTEDEFEYVYEKDINLQLAKKLKKALEKMGYTVGETRPGDANEDCPVNLVNGIFYAKDRPAYVNEQGADYFVSIHCNTYTDSAVYGTRLFYSTTRDATLRLATAILQSMQTTMSDKVTLSIDNQLYILLYSSMPTVLIESGFLTNADDLAKLTDPDWQDQFVCAIAKGVDADLHAQAAQ